MSMGHQLCNNGQCPECHRTPVEVREALIEIRNLVRQPKEQLVRLEVVAMRAENLLGALKAAWGNQFEGARSKMIELNLLEDALSALDAEGGK